MVFHSIVFLWPSLTKSPPAFRTMCEILLISTVQVCNTLITLLISVDLKALEALELVAFCAVSWCGAGRDSHTRWAFTNSLWMIRPACPLPAPVTDTSGCSSRQLTNLEEAEGKCDALEAAWAHSGWIPLSTPTKPTHRKHEWQKCLILRALNIFLYLLRGAELFHFVLSFLGLHQ